MWLLPPIKKVSVFSPNTGKYGPEITPYLETFHAVLVFIYHLRPSSFKWSALMERSYQKAFAYLESLIQKINQQKY